MSCIAKDAPMIDEDMLQIAGPPWEAAGHAQHIL